MQKVSVKVVAWTVVIVVIAATVVWFLVHRHGEQVNQSGNQTTAQTGVAVFAPKGTVTSGFPMQLILDKAAAVTNSYSINYSASGNQYTAQWNSSSSMTSLYNTYKQYLPANSWTITNDLTKYAGLRGLYATNASSAVNIVITAQGKGAQVVVTYSGI